MQSLDSTESNLNGDASLADSDHIKTLLIKKSKSAKLTPT